MAIVTQTDNRTGITYAYETTYYWDKEKQQSRSKRTCMVRLIQQQARSSLRGEGLKRVIPRPRKLFLPRQGPNH